MKTFIQNNKLNNKPTALNAIKSILALVVFLLFIVQSVFIHLYFEYRRREVKREIKHQIFNKIPDNQLVKIKKELSFQEDEFWHDEKMYDVVRSEISSDSLVLYCFQDDKETKLAIEIENQIHNSLDRHPVKKNQKKMIDFLKLQYTTPNSISFNNHFYHESESQFQYNFSSKTHFQKPNLPPPIG